MKLQISFDLTDLQKSLEIAHRVVDHCDIIEIGTNLLLANGVEAIKQFRQAFEKKTLVADAKLIDCGEPIINHIADAGADWITVLGGATNNAIHSMCKEANKENLKVLLDLSDAASKAQTAMEAKNLGAHALIFHQPYNEDTSLLFLDTWQMVQGNASLPLFVSAHINRDSFNQMVSLKPTGIVIGRSIVDAKDPAAEAAYYFGITSKN